MHCSRNKGFSLVELLVAVVIGLIGCIIIFQVYSVFEGQKRSTTSGGDTSTNLAIAANAIEQAGRHAGYGLNFGSHLGCTVVGWREAANTTPNSGKPFTVKLVPVEITRDSPPTDTNGPSGKLTAITFTRSGNDSAYSVTKIKGGFNMADTESDLVLANMYGITQGDVLIIAERQTAGSNVITCAAVDVRDLLLPSPNPVGPPVNTVPERVVHTRGTYTKTPCPYGGNPPCYTFYNKLGGLATWLTPAPASPVLPIPVPPVTDPSNQFKFTSNAYVMNVGPGRGTQLGLQQSRFSLVNGQLSEFVNGQETAVADGIVFMEAQYGSVTSATSPTIVYSKTMPDPSTNQAAWFNLRSVRMVLIARVGQYEKDQVMSTNQITVWNDSYSLPVTYDIPTSPVDERHYRHRVIQIVIPLRNFFWRP